MSSALRALALALALALAAILAGTAGCGSGEGAGRPDAGDRADRGRADPAPGGFRFVDRAAEAGLDVVQVGGNATVDHIIDSIGSGAAWLDHDGDGDLDLYLAQGAASDAREGPPDALLRNEGPAQPGGMPRFVDVTREAGLGDRRWSFGVAAADVDGDGDVDLHVANWGPDRLYLNRGDGTFEDVAPRVGLDDDGWSVSAAWGDPDRDGDLDLYVARYVEFGWDLYPARGERAAGGGPPCTWRDLHVYCGPRNLEAQHDRYFRNEGDLDGDGLPDFRDRTAEAGLAVERPLFGLAARWVDADGDGDDDLYVANDSLRNAYFLNRGDGTFEEGALLAGLAYNEQGLEQAGMGIAAGDYDRDGRIDLAVTNFSHDHDTLYRNEGDGWFSDVSYPAGIGTPSFLALAWGIAFVDVDLDGWEDLFVARGHVYPQVDTRALGTAFRQPNGLFRNRGDGTFEDVGAQAGPALAVAESSRAVLPADLDGDGDDDLLVTQWNAPPQLLENATAGGRWLAVRLAGTRSNREGLGARVEIEAGGATQLREMRRTAGFAGSVPPVVRFGLGSASRVDRVVVRWPSGIVTESGPFQPDRAIVVEERN